MAWSGADLVNFAKTRWVGRNRPLTGGGATSNVGSKAPINSAPAAIPTQWQGPSFLSLTSINPHMMPGNTVVAHDEAHAPANTSYKGIGLASKSAFFPG